MYVEAQRAQRQSAAEQKKAEDAFNQVSNSISAHLREFVGGVHLKFVHASRAHASCASLKFYSLTPLLEIPCSRLLPAGNPWAGQKRLHSCK